MRLLIESKRVAVIHLYTHPILNDYLPLLGIHVRLNFERESYFSFGSIRIVFSYAELLLHCLMRLLIESKRVVVIHLYTHRHSLSYSPLHRHPQAAIKFMTHQLKFLPSKENVYVVLVITFILLFLCC